MSRSRYEPVPQRDETIILDSIHGSPNYNYNSGIANSVASSRYEPSIINGGPPPSIPNSPPPSFHTHSSPGTPRPTPSTTATHASHLSLSQNDSSSAPSYAELWGVAPSTFGGDTTNTNTIGTSNDALATIAGLKQRIEWLEESIGRLLMEKDQNQNRDGSGSSSGGDAEGSTGKKERDNCCVTFTDASPDLERALTAGKGTNCCVTFRSKSDGPKNKGPLLLFAILFMVCLTIILVAEAGSKKQYPPPHDGEYHTT
ncbi:hypothetical protein IFR05_010015 [Cadophora sp. M221]|nr:hypothetical protein IFR05_010015 [Cadophora sp. M221]